MNAMSTQRNRFFENNKDHSIFTPPPVCKWLKEIIEPELGDVDTIFDPAVGSGNLLDPFESGRFNKIGCDVTDHKPRVDTFINEDFLSWKKGTYPKIGLVTCNPPYNHSKESSEKYGRSTLLPELFAEKVFEFFGKDQKLILFGPMGMRLNTRCATKKQGDRYRNIRDNFGAITSIVTLPLDLFLNPNYDASIGQHRRNTDKFKKHFPNLKESSKEVKENRKKYFLETNIKRAETQQEILFFNMPKLKPHYCLPEHVLEEIRDMEKEVWSE